MPSALSSVSSVLASKHNSHPAFRFLATTFSNMVSAVHLTASGTSGANTTDTLNGPSNKASSVHIHVVAITICIVLTVITAGVILSGILSLSPRDDQPENDEVPGGTGAIAPTVQDKTDDDGEAPDPADEVTQNVKLPATSNPHHAIAGQGGQPDPVPGAGAGTPRIGCNFLLLIFILLLFIYAALAVWFHSPGINALVHSHTAFFHDSEQRRRRLINASFYILSLDLPTPILKALSRFSLWILFKETPIYISVLSTAVSLYCIASVTFHAIALLAYWIPYGIYSSFAAIEYLARPLGHFRWLVCAPVWVLLTTISFDIGSVLHMLIMRYWSFGVWLGDVALSMAWPSKLYPTESLDEVHVGGRVRALSMLVVSNADNPFDFGQQTLSSLRRAPATLAGTFRHFLPAGSSIVENPEIISTAAILLQLFLLPCFVSLLFVCVLRRTPITLAVCSTTLSSAAATLWIIGVLKDSYLSEANWPVTHAGYHDVLGDVWERASARFLLLLRQACFSLWIQNLPGMRIYASLPAIAPAEKCDPLAMSLLFTFAVVSSIMAPPFLYPIAKTAALFLFKILQILVVVLAVLIPTLFFRFGALLWAFVSTSCLALGFFLQLVLRSAIQSVGYCSAQPARWSASIFAYTRSGLACLTWGFGRKIVSVAGAAWVCYLQYQVSSKGMSLQETEIYALLLATLVAVHFGPTIIHFLRLSMTSRTPSQAFKQVLQPRPRLMAEVYPNRHQEAVACRVLELSGNCTFGGSFLWAQDGTDLVLKIETGDFNLLRSSSLSASPGLSSSTAYMQLDSLPPQSPSRDESDSQSSMSEDESGEELAWMHLPRRSLSRVSLAAHPLNPRPLTPIAEVSSRASSGPSSPVVSSSTTPFASPFHRGAPGPVLLLHAHPGLSDLQSNGAVRQATKDGAPVPDVVDGARAQADWGGRGTDAIQDVFGGPAVNGDQAARCLGCTTRGCIGDCLIFL
ncbi:hypothetical protein C8R46DRAFT_1346127 [Mycena filopes]|nr:hypothetical protein C8R46DRAFT_1346127 [Mycena filopes]